MRTFCYVIVETWKLILADAPGSDKINIYRHSGPYNKIKGRVAGIGRWKAFNFYPIQFMLRLDSLLSKCQHNENISLLSKSENRILFRKWKSCSFPNKNKTKNKNKRKNKTKRWKVPLEEIFVWYRHFMYHVWLCYI